MARASKVEEEEVVEEINIFESSLVPKHELMGEDEKLELLQKLGVTEHQLPRIKSADPTVKALGAKKGDVIKITRNSPIAGVHYYYRLVV